MPSVMIAIPTLAAGPTLQSCLESLSRQTFRDFEVILINNGPHPIPAASLNYPLRTLTPGHNTGFGAAVNLAAASSDSEFVACLNDDAEPEPAWLESLVAALRSHPAVGMCASRIQLFGTGLLDSAGMLVCADGSSRQRGHSQPAANWLSTGEALLPSGCAAFYRRRVLEEIGLFDEDFFLYCEDTDLGLRARWAGWRCLYVAEAVVNHRYSQTAGAVSPLKARCVERNRLWVAVKNFPLSRLLLVPPASLLRYLWQLTAVKGGQGAGAGFVREGNSWRTIAAIVWSAWTETARQFPILLRKRADCLRRRKLSSAEFSRLLDQNRMSLRDLAYS